MLLRKDAINLSCSISGGVWLVLSSHAGLGNLVLVGLGSEVSQFRVLRLRVLGLIVVSIRFCMRVRTGFRIFCLDDRFSASEGLHADKTNPEGRVLFLKKGTKCIAVTRGSNCNSISCLREAEYLQLMFSLLQQPGPNKFQLSMMDQRCEHKSL